MNIDTIDSAGSICFKDGKVLLIRYYSHYSFPKGHIEKGESTEECAVRETREESGVDVKIVSSPITVPSQKKGERRSVHFFPSLYLSGELKAQKGESDEVMWASIEDAFALLTFDADKRALEEALRVVGVDIE